MITQRVPGIEVAQLCALAGALARVDQDARVDLSLTDDGTLHAQIEDDDRRRTWLAVSIDAAVMAGIGPAITDTADDGAPDDGRR